jgi:hypothetical protein
MISGTTHGADVVNRLKDGQQVEIKASQVEHGAAHRSRWLLI